MRTVGEILKKARTEKGLSLGEVEEKIKIRAKFLQALEENTYSKLPSPVYIRGFLKNYSEFLGLSSERVLAIFRRQFDERRNLGLLPQSLVAPLRKDPFPFRRSLGMILLFLLPLLLLFAYLYREYRLFAEPPPLEIRVPQDQVVIFGETLEVIGQTDPAATLTLNGQKVFLQEDGTFVQKITLTPGLNALEFIAKNKLGRETLVRRSIRVNP